MKIERDQDRGLWTLKSGTHVLYSGRRSPWENPRLMKDALQRERQLHGGRRRPDSAA